MIDHCETIAISTALCGYSTISIVTSSPGWRVVIGCSGTLFAGTGFCLCWQTLHFLDHSSIWEDIPGQKYLFVLAVMFWNSQNVLGHHASSATLLWSTFEEWWFANFRDTLTSKYPIVSYETTRQFLFKRLDPSVRGFQWRWLRFQTYFDLAQHLTFVLLLMHVLKGPFFFLLCYQ